MKTKGFRCILSGGKFPSRNDDLVTVIVIVIGFCNDEEALNTWVMTAHIHAKLRSELKDIISFVSNKAKGLISNREKKQTKFLKIRAFLTF